MKNRAPLYAALVATTMVWGGSFVAIKQALRFLTPLQLVWMRFAPSALLFAMLLAWRERETVRRLLRCEWRSLCLMGLFSVITYHLALNTGEQLIPAGTASLIIALNPACVFLLSALFLRERVTWLQVMGLGLAFVGLFVIVRFANGQQVNLGYLRGVLITSIAPLSWAAYTVLCRPLAQRYSPLAVTGTANVLGTLPVLVTANADLFRRAAAMPWQAWAAVAFLSLACTVAGFTLWNLALRQLEASRAGGFVYLSPMWGVVFSHLILAEPLNWSLLVGAAVVIGGVALVNR